MKAVAVFPGKKTVQLIEHAEPVLTQATQVKMRMLEVGICGTDRHICAATWFTPPPSGYDYIILGHEALGQVVEVGSEVETVKVGDLVVPEVRRPCLRADCRACRAGHQDFCFSGDYSERGIKELHGYMTEFVVDEARYVHPVPHMLRDSAVLIEPLTIAEKAFAQVLHMQQRLPWLQPDASQEEPGKGMRAVVLGAGPIGLLGAMLLITAGFETIVYSRSPAPNPKATIASAIGASYISSETTSIEELAAQIGTIDLVYEALDAAPPAMDILRWLGPNSIFVFTSQPSAQHPSGIDAAAAFEQIAAYNKVMLGTVNAGHEAFTTAIRRLEIFHQRWPQELQALITSREPMERYTHPLLDKADGIKQVIRIVD